MNDDEDVNWDEALNQQAEDEARADKEEDQAAPAEEEENAAAPAKADMSQAEIDALLNFGDGSNARTMSVIEQIVTSSFVNYDRLPMLDIVFDRLVRQIGNTLRQLTSGIVDVEIRGTKNIRFHNFINGIELPSMIAVVKAEEWDSHYLISINSPLIYSFVDILLGGRRSVPSKVDGRPYTSIERALSEKLIRHIVEDMSKAFSPIAQVSFHLERTETNPEFVAITQKNNASVHTRIHVDLDGRRGFIDILIPFASLEPVRELLMQMFMGEKFGQDSVWESHLKRQLRRTEIDLSAIAQKKMITLGEVLRWEVGSQLILDVTADTPATIQCGDVPIFSGPVGQKNGNISIKIEDDLDGQSRKLNELLYVP